MLKNKQIGRKINDCKRKMQSSQIPANTVFLGNIGNHTGPFLKLGPSGASPSLHLIIKLDENPTAYRWTYEYIYVDNYQPINLMYTFDTEEHETFS